MRDYALVASLERGELESALMRLLGINVVLFGKWRAGGGQVLHVGSFQGESVRDGAAGEEVCGTTWMPRVLDVAVEPDELGFRLLRPAGDPEELVRQRYTGLVLRHEEEVLRHGRRGLVGISEVARAMHPLADILVGARDGYVPSTSRQGAGRRGRPPGSRYLRLLTDMGYIRREGTAYVATRRFPRSIDGDTPWEEVCERFLGRLLGPARDHLAEALRLTEVEPFLRIANSYYWNAHMAGRDVKVRKDDLKCECEHLYGRAPKEFNGRLRSMLRSGALIPEGNLVSGSDEVLGPLLEVDFEEWVDRRSRRRAAGHPPPSLSRDRAGPEPPRSKGRRLKINLTLMEYLKLLVLSRGAGRMTIRGTAGELIESARLRRPPR
jgi:hypothetical protein